MVYLSNLISCEITKTKKKNKNKQIPEQLNKVIKLYVNFIVFLVSSLQKTELTLQ